MPHVIPNLYDLKVKKLNINRQTAIICFELNKITRMILETNTSKLDGIHNIGGI